MEAEEAYFGGKRANMSNAKRKELAAAGMGRGPAGKKDRATNRVAAKVVSSTTGEILQGFVQDHAGEAAMIFTDEAAAYAGLATSHGHEAVNHSAGENVRGITHTNGIESFWSMLKRAHKGTFHKFSPKHLDRYVQEFAGCYNVRDADTIDIMTTFAAGAVGKHLRYRKLIADNGLPAGARL